MFLLSAFVAFGVGACGDDDSDDTTTTTTTSGDGDTGDGDGDGDGDGGSDCPESAAVTDNNGICELSAGLTAPLTEDLTLPEGPTYLLTGPLVVGDDSAETVLTIEPGVEIFGTDGSFVLIQRGSRIEADGTAAAPIVFTSAQEVGQRGPEDWGGLVINGRAPINNGDGNGEAPGEAGTGTYGGSVADDNSGTLRYVRVEFAGNKVDAENELNGIAFQGVGSGTTVDFVQVNVASDDGIEFFGGTVFVKHVLVTGSDDDSVDWTGGWQGGGQFIAARQLPESGLEAERGIEADNLEADNSATPFSAPVLSNVTLIARDENEANGMRLRRGTRGELWNFVVTNFEGFCVRVTEDQTATNVGDNTLVLANHVHNCDSGSAAEGAATTMVDRDGANVSTADAMLNGFIPMAGSSALGLGSNAGITDPGSFFETVDYAGAFDGTTDWTDGWTTDAVN